MPPVNHTLSLNDTFFVAGPYGSVGVEAFRLEVRGVCIIAYAGVAETPFGNQLLGLCEYLLPPLRCRVHHDTSTASKQALAQEDGTTREVGPSSNMFWAALRGESRHVRHTSLAVCRVARNNTMGAECAEVRCSETHRMRAPLE